MSEIPTGYIYSKLFNTMIIQTISEDAAETLEEEEQMEMDEDNNSPEQRADREERALEIVAEQEREIERVAEEFAEEEYARIVEQGRLAVLELERMAAAEADEEAWIERQVEAAAEEGQQRIANAEQAQELERVDYDIAIPSQHSYLG